MSNDRIRFLSDQIFETGGPGKGPKFPKGFVLTRADVGKALGADVTDEYAAGFLGRWVNRNVAEYVRADAKASDIVDVVNESRNVPSVSQPFGTAKHGAPVRGVETTDAPKSDAPEQKPADEGKGKAAVATKSKG